MPTHDGAVAEQLDDLPRARALDDLKECHAVVTSGTPLKSRDSLIAVLILAGRFRRGQRAGNG
jgi:hypothetical protein